VSLATIALGANLGEPLRALREAVAAIAQLPHTHLVAVSGVYASAAMEVNESQPDYFNAACVVETQLDAQTLLQKMLAIEARFGRTRVTWHAARTLDLDLISYDDLQLNTPTLTLPHPRAHLRAFVLMPLGEIAAWVRLGTHGTVLSLLPSVQGQQIRRIGPL
jgi:2-amino-4-hydroxy-6-hydroxymethyldihydropteridine diphosphokinase